MYGIYDPVGRAYLLDPVDREQHRWSVAGRSRDDRPAARLLSLGVSARLEGRYKENVALNDQIESQALEMADMMTSGIVRQFPRAFAS